VAGRHDNPIPQARKSLRDLEREQVESALIRNGWVQSKAARELGLTQRQMGYRIKKFSLSCPSPFCSGTEQDLGHREQ
jgi:Nif-specific regulatory protein